jgi:hypothetical protein
LYGNQETPEVWVTNTNPGTRSAGLSEGVLLRATVQQAQTFVGNQMQEMPWLEVSVHADFDPRIRVVSYDRGLQLEEVVDDRKTNLATNVASKGPLDTQRGQIVGAMSALATARLGPEDPQATKVAQLKGKMRVTIAVETQKIVVEGAGSKVNQPIDTAHGKMTIISTPGQIPQFEIRPQWVNVGRPTSGGERGTAQVNIFNAKGELLSSWALEGNGSSGRGGGAAVVGPLRMEIYVPLRTTEVTLPVELKDVPLPARRTVIQK